MDKKSREKATVILIVAVLAILVAASCILLSLAGIEPIIVAVVAIGDIIILIWLGFHVKDRLKEIDEGLEDAVDNY